MPSIAIVDIGHFGNKPIDAKLIDCGFEGTRIQIIRYVGYIQAAIGIKLPEGSLTVPRTVPNVDWL